MDTGPLSYPGWWTIDRGPIPGNIRIGTGIRISISISSIISISISSVIVISISISSIGNTVPDSVYIGTSSSIGIS